MEELANFDEIAKPMVLIAFLIGLIFVSSSILITQTNADADYSEFKYNITITDEQNNIVNISNISNLQKTTNNSLTTNQSKVLNEAIDKNKTDIWSKTNIKEHNTKNQTVYKNTNQDNLKITFEKIDKVNIYSGYSLLLFSLRAFSKILSLVLTIVIVPLVTIKLIEKTYDNFR